jgi:hypothetical protein
MNELKKAFFALVEKVKQEPSLMISEEEVNSSEEDLEEDDDEEDEYNNRIDFNNFCGINDSKNESRKRTIAETATDSEQETVSEQSAEASCFTDGVHHASKKMMKADWTTNQVASSLMPTDNRAMPDQTSGAAAGMAFSEHMFSSSPNAFQLFSTSPVHQPPCSMPPPLTIPPSVVNMSSTTSKTQSFLRLHTR